ncbi:MAG: SMP-30/gluconolactonase/LRE family protein [Promethearchaeota archaeon]
MSKKIRLYTDILIDGLKFPESPRWHNDKLWFSDMDQHKVMTTDMNGNLEVVVETPHRVSGLGFLPDDKLLIVSMEDNRLLKLDPEGLTEVADMNSFNPILSNDMVVDRLGRAYVGNFGFDYFNNATFLPTFVLLVLPDGTIKKVADDMACPNGAVITPDNKTLIIAETFSTRISAFDIQKNGSLSNRRIWADFKSVAPDGICLDNQGGIWAAAPGRHRVVRVLKGGEITHIVKVEHDAYACMLGGPNLTTLFVATSAYSRDKGRIEIVEVEYLKAGIP